MNDAMWNADCARLVILWKLKNFNITDLFDYIWPFLLEIEWMRCWTLSKELSHQENETKAKFFGNVCETDKPHFCKFVQFPALCYHSTQWHHIVKFHVHRAKRNKNSKKFNEREEKNIWRYDKNDKR